MFSFILVLSMVANTNTNPNPNEWTTLNTSLELVLVAESLVDVMQTRWFVGRQAKSFPEGFTYVEDNPLLGSRPGSARLYLTAAAALLAHAAIARLLPKGYREAWQYITIGVETNVLASNYNMVGGLKLSF